MNCCSTGRHSAFGERPERRIGEAVQLSEENGTTIERSRHSVPAFWTALSRNDKTAKALAHRPRPALRLESGRSFSRASEHVLGLTKQSQEISKRSTFDSFSPPEVNARVRVVRFRNALISVSDKMGLTDLAAWLSCPPAVTKLTATGGTRAHLEDSASTSRTSQLTVP